MGRFSGLEKKKTNPLEVLIARDFLRRKQEKRTVGVTEAKEQRGVGVTAQNKAVTDATTAVGNLRKLIPVLDEFELEFDRAFPAADKQVGFSGKLDAGGKIFKGSVLEQDPELAAAVDQLVGKRSQIAKGLGEVGNLAEQEQKIAMQNVPGMGFGSLSNFFLPDAPATGKAKLRKFRDFVNAQIQTNMDVINSGGDVSGILTQQQQSPIPGAPGQGSPDKDALRKQIVDNLRRSLGG